MGYEVVKDNPQKPRICEVLGVEVGQRFNFNDFPLCDPVTFFVDEDGNIRNVRGIKVEVNELCYMINHAECIVRHPRFTPQEVEDAKTIVRIHADATHLERDSTGGNALRLCFFERNSRPINIHMFPSIKPGESYTLKEIIGG